MKETKESWEQWWPDFLKKKKLITKVEELDQFDQEMDTPYLTEKMCHAIYDHYDEYRKVFEEVRMISCVFWENWMKFICRVVGLSKREA